MNENVKRELYRLGRYSFPPPPVLTVNWSMDSWIKYIDINGRWGKLTEEEMSKVDKGS